MFVDTRYFLYFVVYHCDSTLSLSCLSKDIIMFVKQLVKGGDGHEIPVDYGRSQQSHIISYIISWDIYPESSPSALPLYLLTHRAQCFNNVWNFSYSILNVLLTCPYFIVHLEGSTILLINVNNLAFSFT